MVVDKLANLVNDGIMRWSGRQDEVDPIHIEQLSVLHRPGGRKKRALPSTLVQEWEHHGIVIGIAVVEGKPNGVLCQRLTVFYRVYHLLSRHLRVMRPYVVQLP